MGAILDRSGPIWKINSRFDRALTVSAYAFLAAIIALDLSVPKVNFSVLFSVPMLLLVSRTNGLQHVWIHVILVVCVIYASYYAKNRIVSADPEVSLMTFRLFNRTFSALVLAVLCSTAQTWRSWQQERRFLEPEERSEEDEVTSTAALILCVGLGLVITIIDLVIPPNFNMPILFIVPIYLSSWTGKTKTLWLTSGSLVIAAIAGFILGPSLDSGDVSSRNLMLNRTIVVVGILIMTMFLQFNMHRKRLLGTVGSNA